MLLSVILALVVGAALYYYMKGTNRFFKDRGIPESYSIPLIGGLWKAFFQQKNFAELVEEVYKTHPDAKYIGLYDFTTPMIMIRDPELIKSVTVKNFDHFQDHRSLKADDIEPMFSKNLFALTGERWKEVRNLLSPAFTSSKMKAMFKLMRECAENYGNYFGSLPEKSRCVELKDAFTRYTNDVIATCAFGINVDSMADRQNTFYVYGRSATSFGRWQSFKFLLVRCSPWLCKVFGINLFDPVVSKFFKDLVATTIKTRDEKGIVRPDMIQLMMETRGKLGPGKELTIDDMTAQAFVFFFGGFESTSTLMCFAAYEVGVNSEVQKRLHEEIDEVLEANNGEVTYEAINDMKYLDAIINEALRMYPVIVAVDRACTKPFELPPALPGLKPHVVQKDEFLWIPIYGIQYDPQYYDEPTKFMPERFLDDPKKILNSGTYLSFGLGPRMCIGNRFALLEAKVLLFHVFARCTLKPNSKTSIPMVLSKKGFQMTASDGFWFDIEPRKNAIPVLVNSVSNGSLLTLDAVPTNISGNAARKFFSNAEISAEITGIDIKLIKRSHVILQVISSTYKVDIAKFKKYAHDTAAVDFIQNYGQLSDEAQEMRHKNFKRIRCRNTRKNSRLYTNEDVLNRLLLTTDPCISSIRIKSYLKNVRQLEADALELINN